VVTVTVNVENMGSDPGVYTLTLKIDGTTEQTKKLSLSPGQQQTVQWTISKTQTKSYSVDVNGLTGTFTVESPPAPAAFTLSNLVATPATVDPSIPVTVSVSVKNTGDQSGSTTVELKVNGVVAETKTVTVGAGASTTVTFTVTKDTAGSYTMAVGSLTGSFTVKTPEPPPPGIPWPAIIAAIIIVAAIGYYIYSQRKT
jgi:uncharacterized protein YfaS (alpha-2-macroglobulin family)